MSRPLTLALVVVALFAVVSPLSAGPADEAFVPFVIPTPVDDASAIALPSGAIDPRQRVTAAGEQFVVGGKPLRVWGVNLCFGACFPDNPTAARVARRLAASGVNSVRLHHMDTSGYPRGIWADREQLKIADEALLRLDYFIDQLARNGIYTNVNLHVGRQVSRAMGMPQIDEHYDKMINLFTPELIQKQKEYARSLLDRVNTVRKVRYADDPAVAFVEITNENSLFMWSASRVLPNLPEPYAGLLRGRYNAYLKARYGTTQKLREAWAAGAQPLGENLLANPEMKPDAKPAAGQPWVVEQHGGSAAKLSSPAPGVARIDVSKSDGVSWHVQFRQGGLKLEKGKYYTVTFALRAQPAAGKALDEMGAGAGLNHEPWGSVGFYSSIRPATEWKEYRFGFVSTHSDDDCRLSFSLGHSNAAWAEFRNVALRPGGREGLTPEETLEAGNVALWPPAATQGRLDERWRFLAQTEKEYFDSMYAFLKKDLGVKALVTGTIVFGPLGRWAQGGMDFIDGHAYWQHPHFPGRPWDPGNWTVEQVAMADHPDRATLPHLACERVTGKPFTVSEYNHPAPNDYQAETVPMLASYSAAQGWAGVWLFTYSHEADRYDSGCATSYFDIHANPAKWGFMRAGRIMMDAGLPAQAGPARQADATIGEADLLRLAGLHQQYGSDLRRAFRDGQAGRLDPCGTMSYCLAGKPAAQAETPPVMPPNAGEGVVLRWQGADKKAGTDGLYLAGGATFLTVTGQTRAFAAATRGRLSVQSPAYATLALTALDGLAADKSRKALLTACGRAENEGMNFSADRRTVGRNWGKAPVRIEAVRGTLTLDGSGWRCRALGPAGTPEAEVPLDKDDRGNAVLKMDPRHKTMWYLLERR